MHFHSQRAFCRITRGIRHTDGDAARQLIRMVVSGGGSCMLLVTAERVAVIHRPRAVRRLRRAGHRHGNAVHHHHAARHIGAVAGNGHLPAAFTAHGDHTVFAVQIHRERTAAGNAVFRMLAGTVGKRAFVHHDVGVARFRRLHRHHRHVLIARDGDGQCRLRRIAVRIRDGIDEFFRNALALRHVHTGVQLVAVAAVSVQRQLAMLAAHRLAQRTAFDGRHRLVRQSIRAEHVVGQHVFTAAARLGLRFRQRDIVGLRRRYVVHHVHRDGRTVAVAVRIRHRHGQIMRNLRVRNGIALDVLRGVAGQLVAELQLAHGRVIARHGQGAFICGHNVAGQLAVCKNHHVADDDGSHAVRGVDVQGAAGRSGRSGLTRLRTARQAAFIHRQIAAIRADSAGDGHLVVDIDFRGTGLHGIRSKLRAAVETDIQTPQMIDAVQQIAAAVLVIAAAARGTAGGRAGGGHQVFAKGREEILPADLHTFHLEGRHLFLGIGGVEALQLDGRAILKSQDKIVAIAGQRRRIRGKVEDEASVRSAGDGLCGTSGRLGKTDIGHEGPPKKK